MQHCYYQLRDRKQIADRDVQVETPEHIQALSEAEQRVTDTENAEQMIQDVHSASQLHETAYRYQQVAKLLGPTGWRQEVMGKKLTTLNQNLGYLSRLAEWPLVSITETGAVLVNERPIPLCSKGEQWMGQCVIQCTIAAYLQEPAVILDGADILDTPFSEGLVQIVEKLTESGKRTVVICATRSILKKELPPNWDTAFVMNGVASQVMGEQNETGN